MTYQEVINLENDILNTYAKPSFLVMSIEYYDHLPKSCKSKLAKRYIKRKYGNDWFEFIPEN